ncbi:MAG: diguanylate cyclase [Planctomycetota bacterium]
MPSVVHVLCVDDEPAHAELLGLALEQVAAFDVQFQSVDTVGAVIAQLDAQPCDCLFIDYCLGAETGLDALRAIRAAGHAVPVVLLTAQGDEYLAAEATRAGADEYLIKHDLTPESVQRAIRSATLNSEQRVSIDTLQERARQLESISLALAESNAEIAVASRIDELTGILNRRSIVDIMRGEHDKTTATGAHFAIILADVDRFKALNDTEGHQAGDQALRAVAQVLQRTCGDAGSVGRYGGEEFIVVLPDTSMFEATSMATSMCHAVAECAVEGAGTAGVRQITISAGVAVHEDGESWETIVARADAAMYSAKNSGRNQACSHAA